MDPALIARGMVIGLAIAAPVGPIGILCIRRTLQEGRIAGLVSGLGAASADLLYGAIAALGMHAVSTWLLSLELWLKLLGGAFLCYLGLRMLLSRPAEEAAAVRGGSLFAAYIGTFVLTLTNPLTILSFAAIIAASSATFVIAGGGIALVLGVFLGSAGWWLLLSSLVASLRRFINPGRLRWINLASGLLILGFGLMALIG